MKEVVAQRLQQFTEPGSMGVVTDTRYVRCFWPKLDKPTALFAEGSSGIEVEGPPTPRNVIFPDDTKFADGTKADCFFLRHTEATPLPNGKNKFNDYIAELSVKEARDLYEGKADHADLMGSKEFVHITQSLDDPAAEKFTIPAGIRSLAKAKR